MSNVVRLHDHRVRKAERMLASFGADESLVATVREIMAGYDSDEVAAGLREFIEEAAKETSNVTDPFSYVNPWCPFEGNGYTLNENEFEQDYGMSVEAYCEKCRELGIEPVREEED